MTTRIHSRLLLVLLLSIECTSVCSREQYKSYYKLNTLPVTSSKTTNNGYADTQIYSQQFGKTSSEQIPTQKMDTEHDLIQKTNVEHQVSQEMTTRQVLIKDMFTNQTRGQEASRKSYPFQLMSAEQLYSPGQESSQSPVPGNLCPFDCYCDWNSHNEVVSVICTDRHLTSIPQLPRTTRKVYLQRNNIKSIPCYVFSGLVHLKVLNLSHNNIVDFCNSSLHSLYSLYVVNLAACNLTSLPPGVFDQLWNLKELDLSHNKLLNLDNQPFRALMQLKRLDISNNNLTHIRNGTFQGLSSLGFLSLRSNKLRYLPYTFEPGSMDGLTSLTTLKLQGNQPSTSPNFTYPSLALSQLTNLRHLSLDGYSHRLGHGFTYLANLKSINFQDDGSYCNLTHPPKEFFAKVNTRHPLNISLSSCSIYKIPREFFEHTPTIKSLILRNNELGFDGFEDASYGLRRSNLTHLDLAAIVKTKCDDSHIRDTTFQYLSSTKLRILKVNDNRITIISPRAVLDLPDTLEYFSIFNNNIVNAKFLVSLVRFTNLIAFHGTKQVQYVDTGTTKPVKSRDNNICHNNVSGLEDTTAIDLPMKNIDRYNHVLEKQRHFDFCSGAMHLYLPIPLPKRLERFRMALAHLKYDIPETHFENNKVLRYVDYSRNGIKCFGGPLHGLPSLKQLDLSGNFCLKMSTFMFSDMPNLTTLLLYDNVLGQSLADDVNGVTFSKLASLTTLNLYNNAIKRLAEMAFTSNHDLQFLNISRNALTYFKPNLDNNSRLHVLDLSQNILRGFTDANCQHFAKIKKTNSNFRILISDNEFICDCDNIPFFVLLLQQPDIFKDVQSFKCQLNNGSQLVYSGLEHYLPILRRQCMAEAVFQAVLIAFSLVVLLFGVASVFYYKRWQWQYLYYVGKSRLHIGATYSRYQPIAQVFFTYDQDSSLCRNLVWSDFLPYLHQEGITLVFGETDFPAGPVASSIAGAVTNTSKTLVIFSPDIFQDYLRELEVNLAIMHELHLRSPILIPVLLLDAVTQTSKRQHRDHFQTRGKQFYRSESEAQRVSYANYEASCTVCDLEGGASDVSSMVDNLLDNFPPEISTYLHGQAGRCLIYDGGSEHFWQNLSEALFET